MNRRLGPLPVWGWMVAIAAGLIGLYLYERHQAAAGGGVTATGGDRPDLPNLPASLPRRQVSLPMPLYHLPPYPHPAPKPHPHPRNEPEAVTA